MEIVPLKSFIGFSVITSAPCLSYQSNIKKKSLPLVESPSFLLDVIEERNTECLSIRSILGGC